jgi:anti-sigma B factor antagonist
MRVVGSGWVIQAVLSITRAFGSREGEFAPVLNEKLDWDLQVRYAGDRAVLQIYGELDLHTSPRLLAQVERQLRTGPTKVIIDLTHLLFIDSSGLGTLVACWRRAEQEGAAFSIRNPRDEVALSLEITGLDQILPIEWVADAA